MYVQNKELKSLQIFFVGFNRSCQFTFPTVVDNILRPASKQGFHVELVSVISVADKLVESSRTIKEGAAVASELPEQLVSQSHVLEILDEKTVDRRIRRAYLMAKSFGDPWPETRFRSLKNLVHNLYLQKIASSYIDFSSDYSLFLRPDLAADEPLDLNLFLDQANSGLVTPSWHHFGYLNDRVCLTNPELMKIYLTRFDKIGEYLRRRHKPLHSERFLKYSLRGLMSYQTLHTRFSRIRAGGVRYPENFDPQPKTFHDIDSRPWRRISQ